MTINAETRLKRSHIKLMKSKHTALYSGVIMLGESSVEEKVKTAFTDGVNKRYGRAFMDALSDPEHNAVVLHENLHVGLKHLPHHRSKWKENKKLANIAADLVVNSIIKDIELKDPNLVTLPKCAIYSAQFKDWSFTEIYNFLKEKGGKGEEGEGDGDGGKGKGNGSGGSEPQDGDGDGNGNEYGEGFDEHDMTGDGQELSEQEAKDLDERIDKALREGGILAGSMGGDTPRAIKELLEPKIDWREALREFISEFSVGKDEYTWRKFNRRMLPNDLYLPSTISETVGELIIANDTSGSISNDDLAEYVTELISICETVVPSGVRVLWWDTMVAGEQKFTEGEYQQLASMLKPKGGGGTRVSAVADYIKKKNINAEAVIVFTDGYVEGDIKWDITTPTLWLVTQNKSLTVPSGHKKLMKED